MKSVQLVARRTLELTEIPLPPDPGPGEVMVRIRTVGICGSDLHWYKEAGLGGLEAKLPQILGHEPAGEIAAVGAGVVDRRVGQRVAVEPAITCGRCEFCLRGHHNNCAHSTFMGSSGVPGLFREYAVMPAHNTVVIPDSMSYVEATVIEPLAVVMHILELVPLGIGDTVAVTGAGPMGLLMASVARLAGARVIVGDRVAHRVRKAAEMGADCAVDMNQTSFLDAVMDLTRGRGVDVVFDTAADPATIDLGFEIARLGGRFVLIGFPDEVRPKINIHAAMFKELSIQTVKRSNHTAGAAMRLMTEGSIDGRIISHLMPLEQTPEAFAMIAAYRDGVVKAVIEIQ